jgi:glycosyltransferase involved in cell wall biosynthesis
MRLLLVGAFPYPHHQGSQVYFREQARALRAAGADVELLTYASRIQNPAPERASEDFVHHTAPGWSAPRSLDSGPSWGKPVADLALAMTLRQTIASNSYHDAYDAILTHNAEACIAALLALRGASVPHVYCAHTLLGEELSHYVKHSKRKKFSGLQESNSWLRRGLASLGRLVDRQLARRVDGWIALTHAAQRVMRQSSIGPGELIPPPIPDPEADPEALDPAHTAERFGLEAGAFFLYSGNLDGYQELEILGEAAELLGEAIPDPERRPTLVLASHDLRGEARGAGMPGVTFRHVPSAAEMQALLSAARASLLMRQARGGYPIKLANAHAVGTPTIAFHDWEWGLRDGENSMIVSAERPAATLAGAVLRLAADDDLAARLGRGARALYRAQHQPEQVAARTLALIEKILRERPTPRSPQSAS